MPGIDINFIGATQDNAAQPGAGVVPGTGTYGVAVLGEG